jgi:regulator of sigma E protease
MQLIQFVFGLAALILIHEVGHFIVARLLKVEVEEFGIGFPPRIVKLFERNGTIYSLNWIPLGGFVRPKGENDPSIPGGLAAASPWVRLAVLFAGPMMNLFVGVILAISLFYTVGERITDKVLIRYVNDGSPAADAGLLAGDLFISADQQPVDSVDKLVNLIDQNLGQPVEIVVQRGDQMVTTTLTPRPEPPEGQGPMGVGLSNPTRPIGLGTAFSRGVVASFENVRGILLLPVHVLSGNTRPGEARLVGYKGMYDIYQELQNPLWFFMAISFSLGIMNLMPIPALDGGRILLTLPEIIIRRRIPPQYENYIHAAGFALLLILLIYINLQDFINPIQLP